MLRRAEVQGGGAAVAVGGGRWQCGGGRGPERVAAVQRAAAVVQWAEA